MIRTRSISRAALVLGLSALPLPAFAATMAGPTGMRSWPVRCERVPATLSSSQRLERDQNFTNRQRWGSGRTKKNGR